MTSLWSQDIQNEDLSPTSWMYPVYVSQSSDPVKIFTCGNAGAACDANDVEIHIPAGAVPEPQADAHIAVIDTTQNLEVDGWACTVSASTVERVAATATRAAYARNANPVAAYDA